jgi:hypothetical protein
MRMMLVVVLVACGGKKEAPLTDADCTAFVAKLRECPLDGVSADPKEREANLEWRLGSCKSALAEKPTKTDSLGAGMVRREVRCARTSSCSEFSACMDKVPAAAADEATDRTLD